MRKLLLLCLTFALLVTALMLAPQSGARKTTPQNRRILPDKSATTVKATAGIRVGQPVGFAVSRPLRDLAKEQKTVADPSKVEIKDREEMLERRREESAESNHKRELLGLGHFEEDLFVKNERNSENIRKIDPNAKSAPDGAIAKVPTRADGTMAPLVMPTPTVNFETISLTDTTALPGQGFLPPDTVGDIGPNHYVQMVNSAYRIYSRTGTPLIALTSIGAIWSTISGPCAGSEDGDPIVLYDQLADRWLLSEFCTVANPNNHQLIAISQTGDPTGAYFLYDFMMPNNKFNDYPKFGVWNDGYYMTDNQFNQAGTQFLGAGLFAFDRTKMLSGDPTASFVYFDKAEGCPAACQFGGMLPSDIDGFVPAPSGAPCPFIQFDADEFGATDSLRIFDFHVDFATPANSTLTERTGSPLAVAAFDPREVPSGSRNVIPQPAGVPVDVISDRLMNRLAYRNFGTHESLAMNHSVNVLVNPAFRAGVRYYEIRKTTPAAAYTVQEQGTMSGGVGDTAHRWMGSTALNNAGSQAVGYSVSSSTVFPSIRYAGRLAGDPAGSLGQGEALMVAGTSSQTHSSGRWGDYSMLSVDPVDDCTFWFTQEYVTGASAPDNTRWHTRVGAFQFGPCPAVPKGILNGTITSSAGGAPIASATISAGPFVRTSNGSGVYNIDPIGSGTYSVTVSAPGYTSATVPGVTITTGNTTTQNVQLTPQNQLDPGTASVTAESCAPANSALDPGETVTVNLPIVNNGGAGATTTNLVATLQAVGGVSSPSGPQNYGAVAQGSPAVTRPFTFTVSATCGNFVDITLQLQDGPTNYGNIVYSLRTGTLGAPVPLSVSTGNIATAIPDVSSVDIPIAVASTGAVADVNVKVRLNHTFDGDLTLSLVAPDNTEVTLSAQRSNPNDGGDNYGTGNNDCSGTPTIFDDAAANSISTGVPPFNGTFQPESPLSAMNGKTITGTWKLRVSDAAALDTGTVGCVTLDFQRQAFLCCGVVGTPIIASGGAATITAESIAPANNAPDPGETITANFPLINTGDGNTTNLVATLQNSGGVTPVTTSANYGVVVAGGPAVSRPFTFVASGTCGTNITATLQLQDGAINLGTVTYTFQLGTTSTASSTFSNATAIVIPATGTGATTGAPSTPYPSNIVVSGVLGPVSNVTITLKQITHTFPSDVDILLVGPTGVKFVAMSDVIGGTDWTGQTYTLDDNAAALIPSSGTPPPSGSFKPTNYGTGDLFPAPAPAAPYQDPATAGTATFASSFNGLNPNGTWSLYVVDDAGTDIGTFAGGWDLTITTTQFNCNTQTCTITCPANVTAPSAGPGGAVVNYPPATPTGACGVLNYSTPSGSTFPNGTTMVTVTGANAATCNFNVTVQASGPVTTAGQLIISEFRVRGPSGANDEFIDLYNTTGATLTTQAADASAGLAVAASDGTARCVVPNGTVIPAGGHFLCSNSVAYSISGYPSGNGTTATGNLTYTTDIPDNAGIALFNNSTGGGSFSVANRLDAVGSTSEANTTYKEGTGYPALTPFSIDYSFVRRLPGGCTGSGTSPSGNCNSVALIQTTTAPTSTQPQDTGNNASDFIFVDTNGTSAGAGQRLGAPGPQNLSGPGVLDGAASISLFDSCVAADADPNFVRDLNSVPANNSTFGTVDLRRTFTNNSGAPITRLRFRIVDITTFPSISGVADLRPLTSSTVSVTGDKPPCGGSTASYSVQGTTLEQPPSQPNGSGYNGSLSVGTITTGTPLANGASVDFRMVAGVQQTGAARFCVVPETLPVTASQVSCFIINDTNPPTCTITCPSNVVTNSGPNQNGATVTYPAPGTTGTCGTVNCSPASGSFFPNGVTTVTCTTTAGPSCNFTVTVRPPRYWSTVGSAGTTDEDSPDLVSHDDFAVQLKDGKTGTATVRYNITAVAGITAYCPATQSVVNVRFRNSDNTGAHAQVKFEIHRTNILAGGNDIIYTFNSNGLGTGSAFTSASTAPNIDFDFSNYIYWIEATIFRDQTTQFADLGNIEIFESQGATACP